ncbi:LysR family transcriptional regulator [Phreatobacter aquaticus]|uniref:LysR family transcriptional regulator n=1 Tax=Phreatobacter aquaticus TaxID=2570229 RepID=A0A4D7QQS7_9HYPH|nr:LysR family transcriptional regulator [Phreatobacter aquaticus]QCK86462.1 LysR family transcriptional regulator [Phreatobacter aquaticus]
MTPDDPKVPPRRRLADARPRIRIVFGEGLRLGPGKIELLEAIDKTGSISAAGRSLGMSYRRAWLLVDAMNTMFASPVTTAAAGGAQGGGAHITDFGRRLILAYRSVERKTGELVQQELADLDGDMGPAP